MIQSRRRFMKYLAKVFDLCVLITAFVSAGLVLSNGMTFAEFMRCGSSSGIFCCSGCSWSYGITCLSSVGSTLRSDLRLRGLRF